MAPAMNTAMWEKPAVQRNVAQLRADGVHFVDPGSGWLSCRQVGAGRMAEPEMILAAIRSLLDATTTANKKIVVVPTTRDQLIADWRRASPPPAKRSENPSRPRGSPDCGCGSIAS